jgi:hypothetical protein
MTPGGFCPYKGLQPYTEEDRDYFFGREEDRETVGANLATAPLTIFYGASGVGKSSVLLAGVVPFLRQVPNVIVVAFRTWQSAAFLPSLKAEIAMAAAERANQPVDLSAPLDELLARASRTARATVALILDQFEEFVLYHRDSEEGRQFDSEFARAVNSEAPGARFLVSLREDSLSCLDRYQGRIPNLWSNYLRLEHLDRAGAVRAIQKPLERYNLLHRTAAPPVGIEGGLVEALIEQVKAGRVRIGDRGHGALPVDGDPEPRGIRIETAFLQMVLTRLWNEEVSAGSSTLRLSTLERLGGAQQVVRVHLEEVLKAFEPEEQEVCADLFDRLVTPGGTKIAYLAEDLARHAGELAPLVPAVLARLAATRIVRGVEPPAGQGGSARYEIFHDVLAPAILEWRGRYLQAKERVEAQRRAAAEAAEAAEDAARERDLQQARALAQEQERRASEQAASARRLRLLLGAAAIMFLCAVGFAVLAGIQQRRADASAGEASRATELARQRLGRILSGLELKSAALSGDPARIRAALSSSPSPVRFRVNAVPYGYKNPAGQQIYRFELYPDERSVPGGLKSIALVTYKMDHPTFHNSLMTAGPDRGFRASYDGWGCLRQVIAVIEYADPDRLPGIARFDMCEVLGW